MKPFIRPLIPLIAVLAMGSAQAQSQQGGLQSVEETRRALAEAQAQGEAAKSRAESLEAGVATAREAADKTAQEAAALAARIQQGEAKIAANTARIALIEGQRQQLRAELALRQRPVVELTAALQKLSRRPPLLSLLQRGSLRETVYLRASLEALLPEIERRTSALRGAITRSRTLQRQAENETANLRTAEAELGQRRQTLAALETQQRLALRTIGGSADREAERALALAEQARDLSGLMDSLGESSRLLEALAALPGPVLRPERPELAQVAPELAPSATSAALRSYVLPVAGRLVAGFGDRAADGASSRGLTLQTGPTAQLVAPAPGRVAFAGIYRGYGNIVIIDHGGGWTTLITGIAQLDAQVGERLVGGSPLGLTGPGRPLVTLELRKDGVPVNPLEAVRPG
jgi:septal ring factor EnvC (AmiA/AmiB activator)